MRPDNRHDKLTRDNLLDPEDHHLLRIESVQKHQRQAWVPTQSGHHEAKKLRPADTGVPPVSQERRAHDMAVAIG
ncbi:hypothetical protein GCM10017674_67320 [Streptomyces gardneri]|uniref:Uncharacterized protein n=1 Tax=Streptomyces gardneri TaxID=66892 RepID=A0A4Y3RI18_9ACTN|nr:hypothetical protein SGA01_26290 [Streptomyces gardneri]GHH16875.1 hypothetical protein GCM10017674_67320 [Streptomyces gardneri]